MVEMVEALGDRRAGWADHAAHPADLDSLTSLANVDPASMSGPDLIDAIVSSEKALSLLAGVQMRLMAAFAEPFKAGDPMRLAARLARKHCLTGDDDPEQVQLFVPAAATSLASAEIAAALRIPHLTAGNKVREAEVMTTTLAPTLSALEEGALDRGKARIIADHCRPLSNDHTVAVQDLVLPHATSLNTSELRDLTAHAVLTVDPGGAEERHQSAVARREFSLRPQPDAMATLSAYLPADGAVKIFQVTDLLATASAGVPGDSRGIAARRVDALIDIADHLLTDGYIDIGSYLDQPLPDHRGPRPNRHSDNSGANGDTDAPAPPAPAPPAGNPTATPDEATTDTTTSAPADNTAATPDATGSADSATTTPNTAATDATDTPDAIPTATATSTSTPPSRARRRQVLTRQGRRPHLSVVISESTLAGRDDRPGHLAGFGAIPAELARSIARSAASITALLADAATGAIRHAGELTYRPKQSLRDQIAAEHSVCQFPSCRQPVWRCDIDHRETFDHAHPDRGGHTDLSNTGPLCRRHHLYKHHSEWRLRPDPNGYTMHFTSPTGHTYASTPHPPLPTFASLSVSTGGTALAERLDAMVAFADVTAACPEADQSGRQTPAPAVSDVEELLTAILIRHSINDPGYKYEARPDRDDPEGADDVPPF
jgi:hypothetical protein